ncbi:MAG: HrcA family transcriptional regulator [Synechococcaceae cyanobacterium]|nr:HrcA family transcriptional regulator [Synechococcaceae cyanobacterium]
MDCLPRRQQDVLRATVRHYVDTVEPVGSRTLVRRFGLPASPATVRSAMGALEQRGLLTQPHTSAGRIPSQRGYRIYVDQLLPAPGAAAQQLERELSGLTLQWSALDDLLLQLARRLADLTGLLSLISRPLRPRPQLQAIRLVPSGERLLVFLVEGPAITTSLNLRLPARVQPQVPILERWIQAQLDEPGALPWGRLPAELHEGGALVRQALESHDRQRSGEAEAMVAAGLGGLLAQPEFRSSSSLLPLVQLVEQRPRQLLGPSPASLVDDGARLHEAIWIGHEHPQPALGECAVVQASYRCADGAQGDVALIGPMRMAYATAQAAVQSVATILQRLLS